LPALGAPWSGFGSGGYDCASFRFFRVYVDFNFSLCEIIPRCISVSAIPVGDQEQRFLLFS
jgi:hypothetical protein